MNGRGMKSGPTKPWPYSSANHSPAKSRGFSTPRRKGAERQMEIGPAQRVGLVTENETGKGQPTWEGSCERSAEVFWSGVCYYYDKTVM
jgi:hypothetical protein